MKEKAKREMSNKPVFSRITFFLLWVVMWIGLAASIHPLFGEFYQFFVSRSFPSLFLQLLSALIIALSTLPVEKILLRLGFGQWVKGWIRAGLLGTVLATLLSVYVHTNFDTVLWSASTLNLYLVLWSAILVLPQTWLMRRYGKRTWIFFAFATFSSFVANIIAMQLVHLGLESGSLAIGASAAVMALGLILTIRQTPAVEKAKVDEASARLEDKIADDEVEETEESDRRSSLREAIYAFYNWVRTALHNPIIAKKY
jgi:hypothetical protein